MYYFLLKPQGRLLIFSKGDGGGDNRNIAREKNL